MSQKTFSKLFNLAALVLFVLEVFLAGSNFADNKPGNGTVALALATLWGSVLLIEWYSRGKMIALVDHFMDELMETFQHALELDKKPATKVPVTKETSKKATAKKASK